jgi:hypothetical protein
MPAERTVKIIIRVQEPSLKILRYINKHIDEINGRGIKVEIEKLSEDELTEERVNQLVKKGISRLPAMIEASTGRVLIGLEQIMNSFENVNPATYDERFTPLGNTDDPSISTYWHKELFDFNDKENKYVPKSDSDAKEDEYRDIERKMRTYEMNIPKHRKVDSGRKREYNDEPRGRRGRDDDYDDEPAPRRGGNGRRGGDNVDSDYDQPYTPESVQIPSSSSDDAHGDHLDDIMMRAWIDNNPSGSME